MSERLRAKRISRAPMYNVLSSLLRRTDVKLRTPLAEKLLVVLSFASTPKGTENIKKKFNSFEKKSSYCFLVDKL